MQKKITLIINTFRFVLYILIWKMSLPSLTCFLYRMIKYKIKAEQILPVIPITKKYPTNDMYFQATIINHSFFFLTI